MCLTSSFVSSHLHVRHVAGVSPRTALDEGHPLASFLKNCRQNHGTMDINRINTAQLYCNEMLSNILGHVEKDSGRQALVVQSRAFNPAPDSILKCLPASKLKRQCCRASRPPQFSRHDILMSCGIMLKLLPSNARELFLVC